jgi:hypothetical protein
MRAKVGEDRDAHVEKERARLARMRDAEIEKTIHQVGECVCVCVRVVWGERGGSGLAGVEAVLRQGAAATGWLRFPCGS